MTQKVALILSDRTPAGSLAPPRVRPLVRGGFAGRQCRLKIAPCHHFEKQEATTDSTVGPSWLRHGLAEEEEEKEAEGEGEVEEEEEFLGLKIKKNESAVELI